MRILMIAPEPFLTPRGTPISVYQRLHGLARMGHRVDLLTYHLGEDVDIPGVRVFRVPRLPFINDVKVGPSLTKLLLDGLMICSAITILMRKRYDAIHSHEEAAFFCRILAAVFRTHHVYDMHSSLPRQLEGSIYGRYPLVVKLFETLERQVIKTCDAVITISVRLEDYVIEMNPAANVVMIENLPVQSTPLKREVASVADLRKRLGLNGGLRVVYTGSLERYQGVELLIESMEYVREYHPEVALLLVGGRPKQISYWENEVRKKHLENCVHIVGAVPMEEIPAYLELADILVSARMHGTSVPLKMYSYLLSGRPIVATDVAAHRELLTEDVAVLTMPTKEAFAQGILKLIQDPALRALLGSQARRLAKSEHSCADYLVKMAQVVQMLQPSTHATEQACLPLKELV